MRLPFTPDSSITLGGAFAHGGTASVQRGIMHGDGREEVVALKVLFNIADPRRRQIFQREVEKWRSLRHHRVLSFYGVLHSAEYVALVAPYMNNGDMAMYLERNPTADKLALLCQVAEGLQYLHDEASIIHGDIKAENVLITNAGNALLADFGLSAALAPSGTCTWIRGMNTLRFSAPELLNHEGEDLGRKTCATDVYAFGMLVYQVMTGAPPWPKSNNPFVMLEIMQGCVPPRPTEIDDDLWDLCLRCWSIVPEYRPSISEVLRTLVAIRRAKAGTAAITASARTMSLPIRHATGSLSASGESKRMNPYAVPFRPQRPLTLTSPATATFSPPSRTSSFSSSLYEIPTSANSPPSTMPPSRGSSFSSSSSSPSPSSLYKSSTSSADSPSNSNSSPPSSLPTPSSSYAQLSPTKFAFNVYAKPFYPHTTHVSKSRSST